MKTLKCRCGWSGNPYELFVRPVSPELKITICPECLQPLGNVKAYRQTDLFKQISSILKPENQN